MLLLFLFVKEEVVFQPVFAAKKLLLVGAGIATALPLLYFAKGARRIPLTVIGFLQYIAPTITLLIGVFIFHEPFSKIHMITFLVIWSGTLIFSVAKTKFMVDRQPKFLKKRYIGM